MGTDREKDCCFSPFGINRASATGERPGAIIPFESASLASKAVTYMARPLREGAPYITPDNCTISNGLMKDGQYLDMGTEWDDFSEKSHVHNVSGIQLQNRMLLQGMMRSLGWVGYTKEWWHFELRDAAKYPSHNIRYAQSQ